MKHLSAAPLTASAASATEFTFAVTDQARIVRRFAVEFDGADYRFGMAAVCDRGAGTVTVNLFFGAVPVGQPVQTAVRTGSDMIKRFSEPASTQYGPTSWFHAPEITDPAHVERFIESTFGDGALISNSYNSFWNHIPPVENDVARRGLLECAGR